MRAPALVGIVTALHILGITVLVLIQGCGTTRPYEPPLGAVQPAPPPVLPPVIGTPAPPPAQSQATRPIVAPTQPRAAPPEGAEYTVQKGDVLSAIAQRHGVSTRDLAQYNNLTDANALRVGQVLIIPPYAESQPAATSGSTGSASTASTASGEYVVQPGDTLSGIATKRGTTVAALKAANGLSGDLIRVGQTLRLSGDGSGAAGRASTGGRTAETQPPPGGPIMRIDTPDNPPLDDIDIPAVDAGTPARTSTPAGAIPYTVLEGDTVENISKIFIVSKDQILEYNNLSPDAELVPGTTIKIPPTSL